MRPRGTALAMPVIAVLLLGQALAAPFVVFPKAGALASPDGRFVVRNVAREAAASDFVGTFNSLWLFDTRTGSSRKLCDYLGVAAAAWSAGNQLIVTQYVGKKSARALVFSTAAAQDPVVLDAPTLIRLLPVELRDTLRANDHVFIEGWRVEAETLYLTVWGYGGHDANGFRWRCEYSLHEGNISCAPAASAAK